MNPLELCGTKAWAAWHKHTTWAYTHTQCKQHTMCLLWIEPMSWAEGRLVIVCNSSQMRWVASQCGEGGRQPQWQRYMHSLKLDHKHTMLMISHFDLLRHLILLTFYGKNVKGTVQYFRKDKMCIACAGQELDRKIFPYIIMLVSTTSNRLAQFSLA